MALYYSLCSVHNLMVIIVLMCCDHVGALDFEEIKQSLISLRIKTDEKEIHKLLQRYVASNIDVHVVINV